MNWRMLRALGRGTLGLLFASTLPVDAQAADILADGTRVNPRFQSLWLENGLPDKTVRAISQDSQGFIWLGTTYGLARFDGSRVETFSAEANQPTSLSNDHVYALHADRRGRLWVGTRGGLNLFRPERKTFESHRHVPGDPESLSSDVVLALADSEDGRLWVGTGKGLDLFAPSTGQAERFSERFPNLLGAQVRALHRTPSGDIWVGTQHGVVVGSPSGEAFRRIPLGLDPDSQPIVRAMASSSDGGVWIGTQGKGLFRYDPAADAVVGQDEHVAAPVIFSLESDRQGNLWIGTREDGLYRRSFDEDWSHYQYDPGDATSLRDDAVLALFVDRSDTLWAGSFQAGVHRLGLRSLAFGRHDNGRNSLSCLPSAVTNDLQAAGPSTLLVATQMGLTVIERQTGKCEIYQHDSETTDSLSSSAVLSVVGDAQGMIWAGTLRGLDRVDHTTRSVTRISEVDDVPVYVLAVDDGTLFAGTTDGLFRSRGTSFERIDSPDGHSGPLQFNSLAFDSRHRAWAATNAGLLRLSPGAESLEVAGLGDEPALVSWIGAVHVDAEDSVWAGVDGVGLFRLPTSDDRWEPMRNGEELPDFRRFGTVTSDATGRLWVATPRGLFRIDPVTRDVTSFRTSDGLQSDDFVGNSFDQSASGWIYLGGRRGFNVFDPLSIVLDPKPPQVSLTSFLHFNEALSPGEEHRGFTLSAPIEQLDRLLLTHRDDVVGFEFAALHFSDPARNRFAYKLHGFDSGWTETSARNPRATYTNLDPGSYVFQVRASNPHGVWNEEGRRIAVEVLPAPWVTWWAYAVYALLSVSALTLLYLYRTAALRRQSQELEQAVYERTATIESLLEKKNEEFANLSHEFRTPLTLILGPVKSLLQALDEPTAREKLSVVRRNGHRLLRLVDQLLHMERFRVQRALPRRPRAIRQTVEWIGQSFEELAEERGVKVSTGPVEDLHVELSPDALEKILLNLMSNALKYTPESGTVELSAVAEGDQARIVVRDTGIGIAPEHQSKIFERYHRVQDEHREKVTGAGIGLALVRELAEGHGGTIQLESRVGEGSTFVLHLPLTDPAKATETPQPASELLELELEALTEQGAAIDRGAETEGPGRVPTTAQDRSTTVLVIEDNPDMLRYIAEILSRRHTCLTANQGHEGLLLAWEHVPDLVVSDIMMPGMDGYQVIRNLKDDDRSSHIPVILLTARGDRTSRHRGWQERADEYLTKPFDENELLLRVDSLLAIRAILRERFAQDFAPGTPAIAAVADGLNPRDQAFLENFRRMISRHYGDSGFRLAQMTSQMALSERPLQRKLKALLGRTPNEYLRAYRLKMAGDLLREEDLTVAEVADRTGFGSQAYFATCFKAQYGVTPSAYRDRPAD